MDLDELVAVQAGLVSRRQLNEMGIDKDRIRNQVRARRWCHRSSRVVSTFTGRLDREQLSWLGVLHAGPDAMIGSLSAAAAQGLRHWDRDLITVWIKDPVHEQPIRGVHFFRTRRPLELLRAPGLTLPTARIEPALLLWGGYETSCRPAFGALAAAVQQRLTTPDRLEQWVDQLRPLRRAKLFRAAIEDIAGGAHSTSEADITRMCRRHGIVPPRRQVPRIDSSGVRRATDCEWDLPADRVLVLEVEGPFHMEIRQWSADKKRHRRLSGPNRVVVSCTAWEVRHESDELARDLLALGAPTVSAGQSSSRGTSRGPERAA